MSKRKLLTTTAAIAALSTTGVSTPAHAGSDPFLGELMLVGYTFCPRGWTDASGQLLAISQFSALFSLYGTTYGGDGRTTFALPDLRGRVPTHTGTGPGLSNRVLGSRFGTETNTMTVNQMPSHTHTAGVRTANADADSTDPQSDSFARTPGTNTYADVAPNGGFMANGTVQLQPAGGNQPINNMQPTLTLRYCVALQGIFPSRN